MCDLTGARARRTHVISGVFVPALRHLFTYRSPSASKRLVLVGKCLAECGDYATAAQFDYPNGFWWRFLVNLAELFSSGPDYLSAPLGTSGRVHDCKIVFSYRNRLHGVLGVRRDRLHRKMVGGGGKKFQFLLQDFGISIQQFLSVASGQANLADIPRCKRLLGVTGRSC